MVHERWRECLPAMRRRRQNARREGLMRKLDCVLLAAALAGCATTPISQGGKAEIVFAQNEMIRIRWNPQLTNERDMRANAVAFCGGRRANELDAATETTPSGVVQAMTWRCEPFSGNGGGM
jgi:hypothetical protein